MSIYEQAKMLAGQFTYVLVTDGTMLPGRIGIDTRTKEIVISPADATPDAACV